MANAQSQKTPSSSMSSKPFRASIGVKASVSPGSFKNKYSSTSAAELKVFTG